VQLLVFGELHGYLGKLLGVKVEAEGVLTKLSTAAQCQWRTTTRIGGDSATGNKGKQVRSVGHPQELLGEEVEDGGTHRRHQNLAGGNRDTVHPKWGKVGNRRARGVSEGEADGEQGGVWPLPFWSSAGWVMRCSVWSKWRSRRQ
jgi:hypothetical protein